MRNYRMLELPKFLMDIILSHLILQMRKQEFRGITQLANGKMDGRGTCMGLLSVPVIGTMT